ncbi:MAG: general secretion pathway protein GspK [Betaproteobacteria bacterium]|nr:MAG: general secretion pathway protein GspK [Betaproteobacteria bacterium]
MAMTSRLRNCRLQPTHKQQGIALVLALWLTILLTVIASGFAFSMRSEAIAARNAISLAQARAAADGAVERTLFELSRPRIADAWTADGTRRTWIENDVQFDVVAVDETSKIDLNSANDALLKGLLMTSGGLDDQAAARIVDAIADWRDPDDLKRPNGAEEADYRAANLKYGPANAPFETVGELARVLGVTADLYRRIAGNLTVHSRQAGINAMTASRDVLLALPGVTGEVVDDYLERRREAIENKLPPPPFPAAQAFGTGPIPVWRVHAEAKLPDGVTFVREAVLRPVNDVRRPMVALAWTEGARLPAAAPPAAPAQSATPFTLRR